MPRAPQKSEASAGFADWQTYRNGEFGFEVKYPESWSYEEGLIADTIVFADVNSEEEILVTIYPIESITGKGIFYCGDYVGILERCEEFHNETLTGTIDWEAAYGFASVFENTDSSNAFYILYREPLQFDRDNLSRDFFNQILSTFRFVE